MIFELFLVFPKYNKVHETGTIIPAQQVIKYFVPFNYELIIQKLNLFLFPVLTTI